MSLPKIARTGNIKPLLLEAPKGVLLLIYSARWTTYSLQLCRRAWAGTPFFAASTKQTANTGNIESRILVKMHVKHAVGELFAVKGLLPACYISENRPTDELPEGEPVMGPVIALVSILPLDSVPGQGYRLSITLLQRCERAEFSDLVIV